MQLDISVRLTSQVTTIICHHMKKSIIKKKIGNQHILSTIFILYFNILFQNIDNNIL